MHTRGTQVNNLCYGGQRGAARAREPALLTERSHDGESEGSIERAKASVQGARAMPGDRKPKPTPGRRRRRENRMGAMRSGKAHRLKTCATVGSEGLPVPGRRRCFRRAARMAKRRKHRASAGLEGRSERPATGMGSPERDAKQEDTQVDNLCYGSGRDSSGSRVTR